MNFSKRKSSFSVFSVFAIALSVAALTIAALPGLTNSIARASGAGLEVEVPFEIKALKTPGLVAHKFEPTVVQPDADLILETLGVSV